MAEPAEAPYSDVFISYSHADKEWVREQLVPWLEREGLRVVVDYRDFEIGVPATVNMERAVDRSRFTLLVLSPSWVESQWTAFESLLATTDDPIGKVKPLLLEDCELPRRIRALSWADFRDEADREAQSRALLRALGAAGGSPPPELPEEPPEQVARKGLDALMTLMESPAVRDALLAYEVDFGAVRQQIDVLGEYKEIHDRFLVLEFPFRVVQKERGRLPADDSAWDDLGVNVPALQVPIQSLLDIAGKVSFAADEESWVADLRRAWSDLQSAVDDEDLALLKRSSNRMKRVLDRQPSRINNLLFGTARALRLRELVEALTTVTEQLDTTGLDLRVVQNFERGLEELQKAEAKLGELVGHHNAWQEIDDELRRVEASLAWGLEELQDSWPDLNEALDRLCAGRPGGLPESLHQAVEKLNQALESGAREGRVKGLFHRFRSNASHCFDKLDRELLEMCGNLQTFSEPLARAREGRDDA